MEKINFLFLLVPFILSYSTLYSSQNVDCAKAIKCYSKAGEFIDVLEGEKSVQDPTKKSPHCLCANK